MPRPQQTMPRRICPLVLVSAQCRDCRESHLFSEKGADRWRIKSEAEYAHVEPLLAYFLGLLVWVRGSERSVQCSASTSQPLQLHRAPRHPGLETCSAYATQRKFNIILIHAVSVSGLQLLSDTAYYSLRSMPIYPNVVSTNRTRPHC
jgi:hypothetical protein